MGMGYNFKKISKLGSNNLSHEQSLMGGIHDFISAIDNKKNVIMETGRTEQKH